MSTIKQDGRTLEKFIPFDKLSKKQKRKLSVAKRATWQGLNPVTRRAESKKHYDRKKLRREENTSSGGA